MMYNECQSEGSFQGNSVAFYGLNLIQFRNLTRSAAISISSHKRK